MGIMAGRASHTSFAGLVAATVEHLLDLIDGGNFFSRRFGFIEENHRPDIVEAIARSKIEVAPSRS